MRLKGKTAIVTGAGRGIGRAIALRYAAEGAAVVVNYNASEQEANSAVQEIEAKGGRAVAVKANVADLSSHDGLLQAALGLTGRLDILVNNAGIEIHESVLEATVETWDKTMSVNVRGPYLLSVKAARMMKEAGGGKIIALSSVHEMHPLRDRAAYGMSKGALVMMVRSMAFELAAFNINVNGIAPGAILTDMNRAHLEDPARIPRLLAKIAAGKVGNVEDVTGAAVYLASSDSDYVHGTTLFVDGGLALY
ncbi:MAG: glucose 1-dehydrogenase [Acidobacteriaceae bacterium]|nr:glucose 1-dehydrogenase [Acidobacteriaceae bacterium]